MKNPDKYFGRLGNRMFQMAYLYAQVKKGKIPDFYLQDEKYFKKYKDEIKNLFGENIGRNENIAIHVRRGDYVDNPFYVDLTKTDYYRKAITHFNGNSFIIFSDDPKWCYEQWPLFDPNRMAVSMCKDEIHDLNFMASCKGIIMANSSYSWWGAYLGFMKKEVIAPKQWFTNKNMKMKMPKEWKKI